MKKAAFWFYILHKRLFKKTSFVIILLLIPLLTWLMTLSAKEESGFVRVVLSAENSEQTVRKIAEELSEDSDIVVYQVADTTQEALSLLKSNKADAVWVPEEDLLGKLQQMAARQTQVKLAHIYAVETNNYVTTATEQLYGALFDELSWELYEQKSSVLEGITEQQLRAYYDEYTMDAELIQFEMIDGDGGDRVKEVNYLTAPLRGLLVILMLLCGMAAMMYFRADEQEGVYDSLPLNRRFIVSFGNNLAALGLSAVVVTLALKLSNNYIGFFRESIVMMLFVLMCAAFCTLFGAVFMSLNTFGLWLPVILVLAVAMSPIFFNVQALPVLRMALPTHYYLYGLNDPRFIWQMAVYAVAVLALAYVLYRWRISRKK